MAISLVGKMVTPVINCIMVVDAELIVCVGLEDRNMKKAILSFFVLLLSISLLFSGCDSTGKAVEDDQQIPHPDAFFDVMSISDGRLRVLDFEVGVSYNEFVGEIFSEDELDLQFYSDNGKITIKQPLAFSETGGEKCLISFYFVDDCLTRVSAGITFLDTPLSETSACISSPRDLYQAKFGDEVFSRELGPSFA